MTGHRRPALDRGVREIDPADLVGRILREPEVAVGAGGDADRPPSGWSSVRESPAVVMRPMLLCFACSINHRLPSGPTVMPGPVAVGAGELGDRAAGVIRPILPAAGLGEPEVAVGAGGDAGRFAIRRGCREVGEYACRGDAPDPVAVELSEPEVAVGAGGDAGRPPFAVGKSNSVTVPVVVMRPILLAKGSVNHRLPSGPAVMVGTR